MSVQLICLFCLGEPLTVRDVNNRQDFLIEKQNITGQYNGTYAISIALYLDEAFMNRYVYTVSGCHFLSNKNKNV